MEYEASSSTNGTMIALITSGVSVTIGRTIRSPDHIVQVVQQTGGRLWGSLENFPVAVQCCTHRSGSAREIGCLRVPSLQIITPHFGQ